MLCLAYWRDHHPEVMIVVRRTATQGDIRPDERRLLENLSAHFEAALNQLRGQQGQSVEQLCLERCLAQSPVALLIMDFRLEPRFRSPAALRYCQEWNYPGESGRVYDERKSFRVPAAIGEACEELKRRWQLRFSGQGAATLNEVLVCRSPLPRGPAASVRLTRPDTLSLAEPCLVVELSRDSGNEPDLPEVSDAGRRRLHQLTPREREVALAVVHGLSNEEIARSLGKSIATVKAQLGSTYEKLSLRRRSQLVAALQ